MAGYRKTYRLPDRELDVLRNLGASYADSRTAHDGYLSGWIERNRFERDGKQWVTVQERGQGWAAALALDGFGDVVEVVALSPEQARALEPVD